MGLLTPALRKHLVGRCKRRWKWHSHSCIHQVEQHPRSGAIGFIAYAYESYTILHALGGCLQQLTIPKQKPVPHGRHFPIYSWMPLLQIVLGKHTMMPCTVHGQELQMGMPTISSKRPPLASLHLTSSFQCTPVELDHLALLRAHSHPHYLCRQIPWKGLTRYPHLAT